MGTNYYWHAEPVCSHCGRSAEPLHIGKSSAGWCFALHVYTEPYWTDEDGSRPKSLDEWRALWRKSGSSILDEYGHALSAGGMLNVVTQRGLECGDKFSARWLSENHAIVGPYGLARRMMGRHCVGHGDGTWDLVTGNFS